MTTARMGLGSRSVRFVRLVPILTAGRTLAAAAGCAKTGFQVVLRQGTKRVMIEEADGTGVVLRSSWPWRLVTALAPVLVFVLAEAVLLHGDRPAWNLADAVLAGVVWAGWSRSACGCNASTGSSCERVDGLWRSGRRTVEIAATAIQAVTLERFLGGPIIDGVDGRRAAPAIAHRRANPRPGGPALRPRPARRR